MIEDVRAAMEARGKELDRKIDKLVSDIHELCEKRKELRGVRQMTESEERFERIERSLENTNKILGTLAESQAKTNVMITELVKSVAAYVDSAAAASQSLSQSVADYVASSKARIERTEASLDNLIRLIASEHKNGEKK